MNEPRESLEGRVRQVMDQRGLSWGQAWDAVHRELSTDEIRELTRGPLRPPRRPKPAAEAIAAIACGGAWPVGLAFVLSITNDRGGEPSWPLFVGFSAVWFATPIVLGVVALRRIRRSNGTVGGTPFAWSGIVLPVFWVAIAGAMALLVTQSLSAGVDIGTCLPNGASDVEEALFWKPRTVACDEGHLGEIYGVVEYPINVDEFPGQDVVSAVADAACFSLLVDYLGGPPELADARFMEFSPMSTRWALGDREILCLLVADGPMVGSLKGSLAHLGLVSMFDADPGTCFADDAFVDVGYGAPTSCADPHTYEVVSRHVIEGTEYPGDDSVWQFADDVCLSDPATASFGSGDMMMWFAPIEGTWAFGDRTVFCIAELSVARTESLSPAA